MSAPKAYELTKQQNVTVISINTHFRALDELHVVDVNNQLVELVQQLEPPFVVIDLSEVTFFGSSFLEVLFRLWNQIQKRDGELSLCGLQEHCAEVVHISHLDRLWKQFDNCEEAVGYLQQKTA